MNPVKKEASMNNKLPAALPCPLDRAWVNVAMRIQRLQLVSEIDWNQVYEDAYLLQEISSGPDGMPTRCPICGEPTDNCNEVMRGFIDFGVGAGPATEIEYTCNLCESTVAYWAYGYWEPRF